MHLRAWQCRRRLRPVAVLVALLPLWLLGACADADSLGGAAPTVVAVSSPPTWDGGVGTLMQLKCGVCHQVPPADISPATIPQSFDLNYHLVSPTGVPGAANALVQARIALGILRGPAGGVRQMPLDYATPLDETEIAALEAWVASGAP